MKPWEVEMVDWEMKASQLAEDLGVLAVAMLWLSVWLWIELDGWATVFPVVGVMAAINALARSAKIRS